VKAWAGFVKDLREGLEVLGLQEVRIPSLVTCPGMEAQLEPFATEWVMGEKREKLFLPTSPELHMKKLLALGWTDIFELKTCFRNGEMANLHEPEFEMLEWYRAYSDLGLIQEDLLQLIHFLGSKGWVVGSIPSLEVFSVSELFAKHVEIQLTPTTTINELREACGKWGIPLSGEESWDDVFFLLFLSRVESQFLGDRLVLVYDYPPSQAALARLTHQGWADRFELYWRGVELANAFHELNDPDEQRARFEQELVLRDKLGKTAVPVDEGFLRALDAGMPPSGGIALGVDRLFMVCQQIDDIKDTRCFSARSKA
jgi:lysyl-tRNA synthetase class 2